MPEELRARDREGSAQQPAASDNSSGKTVAVAQAAPSRKPAFLAKLFGGNDERGHAETTATAKLVTVAAAEKPAAKPAAKPAESSPPCRCRKRGPRRSERGFQLASATASRPPSPRPSAHRRAQDRGGRRYARPPAVAAAPAKPVATPATYQVASATSQPVRPAHAASLMARADATANDIINDRGFWQGLPSAEAGRGAADRCRARRRRAASPRRHRGRQRRPEDDRQRRVRKSRARPLAQRASKLRHPKLRRVATRSPMRRSRVDRPCASGPADGLGHHASPLPPSRRPPSQSSAATTILRWRNRRRHAMACKWCGRATASTIRGCAP